MLWLQRYKDHFAVFAMYVLALGVAYSPVVSKNFSADDFRVIWRVCHDRQFVTEGFFRVLSDGTLYLNYLAGGYQPIYFNLFNLLVHLSCSLLIYLFCMQTISIWSKGRWFLAFCAGFFFLLYPFHSEAVVWIVGRGASLSTFFALIAICISVSGLVNRWKFSLASFSFLIGLLAYESILSLPLIILLIHWRKYRDSKALAHFMLFLGLTVFVYFVLRIQISGSVLGAYGGNVGQQSLQDYAGHFLRIMARLIAPPNQDPARFILFFSLSLLAWMIVIFFYLRSRWQRKMSFVPFTLIGLIFLCSIFVAVSFPVSTRTTSTDRLLYFPSVFLCIGLAMLVSELTATATKRGLAVVVIGLCGLWGIQATNRNWAFASESTSNILSIVKELSEAGVNVYILNVPDEYLGAYMLAGVLNEALLINGVDTSRARQVNLLLKEDNAVEGRIRPVSDSGGLHIFPGVSIIKIDHTKSLIRYSGRQWLKAGSDQIWYWDRESFKRLE